MKADGRTAKGPIICFLLTAGTKKDIIRHQLPTLYVNDFLESKDDNVGGAIDAVKSIV